MSRLDDRLTRGLEHAARPADPSGVFERIDRRRARRHTLRRVQAMGLAVVVIAGSVGGFVYLTKAFGPTRTPGGEPPVRNGLIVVSELDEFGLGDLYAVDPSTGDARQLTSEGAGSDGSPAVSPDGRTVAFVRTDHTGSAIFTIGIDGTDLRRISEAPAIDPAWSPDGSRIAFVRGADGRDGIWIMGSDGTDPNLIPGSDALATGNPAWSPDGTSIAFEGARLDGDGIHICDIYTIPVDASGAQDLHRLTDTPDLNEISPSWSPDGTRIVFSQLSTHPNIDKTGGIAVMGIEGGDVFFLTTGGPYDNDPAWSPDGSLIAFVRSILEPTVYTIRPDRTDLTKVVGGVEPAWQPIPPGSSPAPASSPTPSDGQVDIGLGFPTCNVEALNHDFNGDGTVDTAWTATKALDAGPCPTFDGSFTVVAVDVTGDGVADGSAGPLAHCVSCYPFAATDLDGDGVQELVVIAQWSSVTEYTLFSIHPEGAEAGQALRWIGVAPPGDADAGFPAGEPFTFWAGGDEGYASYVGCADDRPDLLITQTAHPVEGPGSDVRHVNYTELRLVDGRMQIIGRNHSTESNSTPFHGVTGPACGVDFWPGP